jgi:ESCRT-I complex subunit TSG101
MVNDPRVTRQLSRLGGLYRDPARVDRDATAVLRSSVGEHLTPIASELYEDKGSHSTVLVLQGTIAMDFRGTTYQLLMDVYLPGGYPQRPPVCYVRLADHMYLKENHRHVASDGKVYLPYLHEWTPQQHNLVELVIQMSSVFSADPPVFSRAPAAVTPPPPPAYAAATIHNDTRSSRSTTTTTTTNSNHTRSSSFQREQRQREMEAERRLAQDAAEANAAVAAARRAAQAEQEREVQWLAQQAWEDTKTDQLRQKLTFKTQRHFVELSKQTQQQVQADERHKQSLVHAESKIDAQIKALEKQKETLEGHLSTTREKTIAIQASVRAHEERLTESKEAEAVPADELVKPASALHAQMVALAAENAALTDVLYFLDRGLYAGKLDAVAHLKQVRKLAKKQFLVRAHLIKINQVLLDSSNNSRR